jgi:hypothetical protein
MFALQRLERSEREQVEVLLEAQQQLLVAKCVRMFVSKSQTAEKNTYVRSGHIKFLAYFLSLLVVRYVVDVFNIGTAFDIIITITVLYLTGKAIDKMSL